MRDFGAWFNEEAERLSETTIDPYAAPAPPREATQPPRHIINDQHQVLDDDGCPWVNTWHPDFDDVEDDLEPFYGD